MITTLRRQVLLRDAVYNIAKVAREADPDIARIFVETSDQGEYLTTTGVGYRVAPDTNDNDIDDAFDTDDAVTVEDWACSLSWGDANDDAPGWHTISSNGGYYYIDVDEALAAEEPVEIKPVDLIVGVLVLHQERLTGPRCKCGEQFESFEARRQHVAEKIVEVLS